jgi:diamine N-acetyltransferase
MVEVHLRPVTLDNYLECICRQVEDTQAEFVAPNARSLAEAKVNPTLVPLAIYEPAARGYPKPAVPMVGFTMYELTCGVGFILRLMIDRRYQRQGYGRAAMVEIIRRLKLIPEVEMIATSHRRSDVVAAHLYRSLGFVAWDVVEDEERNPEEIFVQLPNDS